MSPRKKTTSKVLGIEASGSGHQAEGEPKIIRATYDDTSGLLKKDEETLQWGDVYHMFKKLTSLLKLKNHMNSKCSKTSGSQAFSE